MAKKDCKGQPHAVNKKQPGNNKPLACQKRGVSRNSVQHFQVTANGIQLMPEWLESFGFNKGSQSTMLVMPEYLVITTHPKLRQQLAGLQELQYRQDELKADFSFAIERLANDFAHSALSVQPGSSR